MDGWFQVWVSHCIFDITSVLQWLQYLRQTLDDSVILLSSSHCILKSHSPRLNSQFTSWAAAHPNLLLNWTSVVMKPKVEVIANRPINQWHLVKSTSWMLWCEGAQHNCSSMASGATRGRLIHHSSRARTSWLKMMTHFLYFFKFLPLFRLWIAWWFNFLCSRQYLRCTGTSTKWA